MSYISYIMIAKSKSRIR